MSKARRPVARHNEADHIALQNDTHASISGDKDASHTAPHAARLVHHLSQRLHHRTNNNTTQLSGGTAGEASLLAKTALSAAREAAGTLNSHASALEQPNRDTHNRSQASALPCTEISLYLQNAIREVVEQMRSPHSAHDTARHVLLTDELLHGDAAWGFTPTMILAGVDTMLELFTEAFLQGKQLTHTTQQDAVMNHTLLATQHETSSARHAVTNATAMMMATNTTTMSASLMQQQQQCGAVPVEGFLPPLIPHVQRVTSDSGVEVTAMEIYKAFCAAHSDNSEWAAKSATSGSPLFFAQGTLPQHATFHSTNTGIVTNTGATSRCTTGVREQHYHEGLRGSNNNNDDDSQSTTVMDRVPSLRTVPEALHALIVHCGRPLSCLTLQDQQCMPLALQTLSAALARLVTRMQDSSLTVSVLEGGGIVHPRPNMTTPRPYAQDTVHIVPDNALTNENIHKNNNNSGNGSGDSKTGGAPLPRSVGHTTPRLSGVQSTAQSITPQAVSKAERAAMARAIRVAALQTISNLLYGCCGANTEEEEEEESMKAARQTKKPRGVKTSAKNAALCAATTQAVDFTTPSSSSSHTSADGDLVHHLCEHWDALLLQQQLQQMNMNDSASGKKASEVIVVHMRDSPETDSEEDDNNNENDETRVEASSEVELGLVLTIFDQLCGLARRKREMESGLALNASQTHSKADDEHDMRTTGERLTNVLVQLVPVRALRGLVLSHNATSDTAKEEEEQKSRPPQRSSQRVASLCVDLLWHVMRLDERGTSQRVLYASPTITTTTTDELVSQTAMSDAFEALVQQLNGSYMAWHREVRNDLVLWLTLVLRNGSQLTSNEEEESDGMVCGVPPKETIDAINAIALVLFDLVCGSELDDLMRDNRSGNEGEYENTAIRATDTPVSRADTSDPTTTSDNINLERTYEQADSGVRRLLARRAVRQYALRYFTLASPAVRKDNLQFKIAAWQLLEAFCEWQAVTTMKVMTNTSLAVSHTDGVNSAKVLEALGVVDLLSLGLMDVWIMYVDTLCPCATVVSWTRDELLSLEAEAWELMTNLMECHHQLLSQMTQTNSSGASSSSTAVVGLMRYADVHFLQAGGLGVLLRYLHDAPTNVEPLKRMAMTLLSSLTRLAVLDVQTNTTTNISDEHSTTTNISAESKAVVLGTLMQSGAEMVSLLLDMLQPHAFDFTLTGDTPLPRSDKSDTTTEKKKKGGVRRVHTSSAGRAQTKATLELTRAAQQRDAIAAAEAARAAHEAASRLRGSYPTGTLVTQCVHLLDQLICLSHYDTNSSNSSESLGWVFVRSGGLQTMRWWWSELLETLRHAAQAGPETLRHDLHDMSSLFLALLALLRRTTLPTTITNNDSDACALQAMRDFVQQGGMTILLDLVEVLLPVTLRAKRADNNNNSTSTASEARVGDGGVWSMASEARTSTQDDDLRHIARDLLGQLLTVLADMLHDNKTSADTGKEMHTASAVLCKTAFLQWRSTRYMDETHTIALNAVQLLLLLWQACTSIHHSPTTITSNNVDTNSSTSAMAISNSSPDTRSVSNLHDLGMYCAAYRRLHEAIQHNVPRLLREDYVRRLLQRKVALQQPVVEASALKRYYEHAYGTPEGEDEDAMNAEAEQQVVSRAMSALLAISDDESHARQLRKLQTRMQLCFDVLGLKVYSCLAALGFDTLCEGGQSTNSVEKGAMTQSILHAPASTSQPACNTKENNAMRVDAAVINAMALSAKERAQLMLVAALPMLCVEEIHMAVAQTVGVVGITRTHEQGGNTNKLSPPALANSEGDEEEEEEVQVTMRPCTPDVYYLRERCAEAESCGVQLVQLAALHAQLHETQVQTDYERFLVSRLRQPIGEERHSATIDNTSRSNEHYCNTLNMSMQVEYGSRVVDNAEETMYTTMMATSMGPSSGLPEPSELAASLAQRCVRRQQQDEDTLLQRTLPRATASQRATRDAVQQQQNNDDNSNNDDDADDCKLASVRLAQSVALPPRPLLARSLPLPLRPAHSSTEHVLNGGILGEVVEGLWGSQRLQDALLFTTKPPVRPPRPLMALRAKKLNMLRNSLKALPPLEIPSEVAKQ